MKSLSAILFDLEGTLVDFQWNLKAAAEKIKQKLTEAGINLVNYGDSPDYATLFNTTRIITAQWPESRKNAFLGELDQIYDHHDADALSRWQPYPDTLKVLETLAKKDCRMGIVSNCGHAAASAVLQKYRIDSFFDPVISRNDVSFVKPDTQGLSLALSRLDLTPSKVLFVGDSVNDIQPARKLGMPSCFLSCGESLVSKNPDNTATYKIKRLSDLLGILQ